MGNFIRKVLVIGIGIIRHGSLLKEALATHYLKRI